MDDSSDPRRDLVFYDGECGLCHATVRFAIRHDPRGDRFVFAPLGGATWKEIVAGAGLSTPPDSVVVRTDDGAVLFRSAAVLHLLHRCDGRWSLAARILGLFPRAPADLAYRLVARARRHVFGVPAEACPVPPGPLRTRFLP